MLVLSGELKIFCGYVEHKIFCFSCLFTCLYTGRDLNLCLDLGKEPEKGKSWRHGERNNGYRKEKRVRER